MLLRVKIVNFLITFQGGSRLVLMLMLLLLEWAEYVYTIPACEQWDGLLTDLMSQIGSP